ncbi:MAG: hypothetical protein ACOCP8_07810 [archaeon]
MLEFRCQKNYDGRYYIHCNGFNATLTIIKISRRLKMRPRDLNDLLLKKFNGINNDNQVLGFPSKKKCKKMY